MSPAQTMFFGRILSVIFLGAACFAAAGAEPPADSEVQQLLDSTSAPENVSEILRLAHALARTALYQRDDFYSEETMHRLFGGSVDAKAARGAHISIVSMHGFTHLITPGSVTQLPTLNGIWFEARKANNGKWRRLDVTFWGAMPGLDFDDVVEALGPGWKRDPKAERERDFAIMREPFNPPLPTVSHPMGRAFITYPAGTATLVLEFDTQGKLHSARSDGGCIGKKDCRADTP